MMDDEVEQTDRWVRYSSKADGDSLVLNQRVHLRVMH